MIDYYVSYSGWPFSFGPLFALSIPLFIWLCHELWQLGFDGDPVPGNK